MLLIEKYALLQQENERLKREADVSFKNHLKLRSMMVRVAKCLEIPSKTQPTWFDLRKEVIATLKDT